jgi:serine protease Do
MKISQSLGAGSAWLFALLSCATPHATAPVPPSAPTAGIRRAAVRDILGHNVRLHIYEGEQMRRTASGVVIGSEPTTGGSYSYVLTNAHALDPAGMTKLRIGIVVEQEQDEIEYAGEPAAVGAVPEMDLAVVRVRGAALSPAKLATDTELTLGDDVMVVAAPYGKAMSLSGGMISQVEWDRQLKQPRMLKTDASIGYGASGGGIYSRETGKLLAIVEGYRTAKVGFAVAEKSYSFDVPMPGETFGAPTSKIRRFLQAHGFERFTSGDGVAAKITDGAAQR